MPGEEVRGVSLEVYEGEILGIGGLAGQGKLGIPNGVMSLYDTRGSVTLFGEELKLGNAGDALRAGIAMVSEDRKGVGLLLDQSIEDNIVFNAMQIKGEYLHRLGPVHPQEQQRRAQNRRAHDSRPGYPLLRAHAAHGHAVRRQPAEGMPSRAPW